MARKILLADDSVTAQNMGRKILADAGYEVLTVNNGSAALKKIAEAKPELIVLDVYMPGYSGLEVCQRLKEAPETARIPILLTVGKLEPFKPEEAKRVRADAFIVKPFEASELLSALSKLEDKMVPRSEPSKPGRFARANAALDQAAYDKTVAIDEDSGWKNRISFPSKKKKEKDESVADDPTIYNAVNKDLRTVVDPRAVAPAPSGETEKVNLAALAPEGLPKDVTPEEIAALAAAAAQVKGTLAEAKPQEAEPVAEPKGAELKDVQPSSGTQDIAAEAAAPTQQPAESESKPEKPEQEFASLAPPTPAEVMDAIVALERQSLEPQANPANGSGPHVPADEPVTMAVAAAVGSPSPSRWTAVAVALAADEASVSLEQEMQQAHAAVLSASAEKAAAPSESKVIEPVVSDPVAPTLETVPEAAAPVVEEPKPAEPVVQAVAEPEIEQVADAVSTDAIKAAVRELEAVAAAYEAERQSSAAPVVDDPRVDTPKPENPEPVQESTSSITAAEAVQAEKEPEAVKPAEETKPAEAVAVETAAVTAETTKNDPAALVEAVQNAVINEVATQLSQAEAVAGISRDVASKESEIAETTAAAWASWRRVREAGSAPLESENPDHRDSAAMAAAAGAEKSPEASSTAAGDPADIANIVDSVLADLRPKIVEEISRKLGKKS